MYFYVNNVRSFREIVTFTVTFHTHAKVVGIIRRLPTDMDEKSIWAVSNAKRCKA